jgi:hypothetical protein
VTLRFTQRFDFNGTECRVNVVANVGAASAADPELVRLKGLEQKPEDLFAIEAVVNAVTISLSRPFTMTASDEQGAQIVTTATGAPPTISMNLRIDDATFTVKPVAAP